MVWPHSQDYNEAVQDPASCFADNDLRAGQVVTNPLGLPMPCSGNFADVYEVRSLAGRWAVKCFTRQVPGLRERYAAISAHLRQARLRFMVEFKYLEQGIRVGGQWYPVLKMDWIEGFLLNHFIRDHLDRPAMLEALADLWVRVERRLRRAGMAHGDLQHGNVLLVPGSSAKSLALKLIDYDGMFAPALAGVPSGEVGHPNYQHPLRLREATYNAEVDRFPLLAIYAAIRALIAGGRPLWDRYDNGDNLLFRQQDLEAPSKSALFYELLKSDDPSVRALAEKLIDGTRQPLDRTALLEEFFAIGEASPDGGDGNWWEEGPTEEEVPEQTVASPEPELVRVRRPVARGRARRVIAALCVVALLVALVGVIVLVADNGVSDPTKGTALVRKDTVDKPRPPTEPALPKTFKNSLGMEFVLVPKGKSWLGGGGGTPGNKEVEVAYDFYLGKYEVTQEEWQKVMGNNPSYCKAVAGVPEEDLKRFPVEQISWDDTQSFLSSVNKREHGHGWAYRLPTEVEWEYACRGGPMAARSRSAFDYYLDEPTNQLVSGQVNFEPTLGLKRTCKVGSYKSNRLGLYDMHGNVSEWCSDIEKAGAGVSPRMHRGGSWGSTSVQCRAVDGGGCPPSSSGSMLGLRLARVPAVNTIIGQPEVLEEVRRFPGNPGGMVDVAFSPDGRMAASGGADKTVRVWDVETAKEVCRFEGHTEIITCLCFCPDGRRVVSGSSDKTVRLWDITTGKEVRRFDGHTGIGYYGVRVTPDGKHLLSGSEGSSDNSVRVWDVESGKESRQFDYRVGLSMGFSLWIASYSQDGRRMLSGSTDNIVRLWDVDRGQQFGHLDEHSRGGTISSDGRFALCIDCENKELRLYDLESRKLKHRFDPTPDFGHVLAFSLDSQRVLVKYIGGDLGLWDVASGKQIHHFVTRCTGRIVFSPDGRFALGGLPDGSLPLWRVPD